jgi:NodT family efflux transporter outer membrane factor (OMF) lipoprotein
MNVTKIFRPLLAGAAVLAIQACSVGPDYTAPPPVATPAAYKELAGWKPASPEDAIDRGAWWSIYKDPVLDGLERKIDISNQTLKEAEAAYRQARALADQARASFLPSIGADGSFSRQHESLGRGGSVATAAGTGLGSVSTGSSTFNTYSTSASTSWEIDIWGDIRRTVESDVATAQASAADIANARLSAQATLATDYFELRYQEELKRLLDTTIEDYKRSLQITQNQYNAGVAAKADVLTAQTQLLNAQSQEVNAGVLRATLEHAIAVLTGAPPGDFAVPAGPFATDVPVVPTGVPSTLLERRPDIAAAERTMAAANAKIGVAIAAYFPSLTLTPSYGYSSSSFGHLISSATNVWSLGGTLAETIFDAGSRSAQVEQARAAYDQDVASYRQTVLSGFQQVEDQLSTLRILEQQNAIENQVVASAREAARLTLNQYKAGTVPYSSVITAQTTALSNEETALAVTENRLVASATLVEALGGGWDASLVPRTDQVEDDSAFLHVIPVSTEHPETSEGLAPGKE